MSEEKFVRKILRSFPKKFDMNVTPIEEAQDFSTLKVDELIGSLRTFEVSINGRSKNKNKGVTFVSNYQESEDRDGRDTEESLVRTRFGSAFGL